MGKKALWAAVVFNLVLALMTGFSLTRPAQASADQGEMAMCCIGGQCQSAPSWRCFTQPSCQGPEDCGLAISPETGLPATP